MRKYFGIDNEHLVKNKYRQCAYTHHMEARFSFTNNNKSANKALNKAPRRKVQILDNVLLLCFVELTE
jgi:hypothetical protein